MKAEKKEACNKLVFDAAALFAAIKPKLKKCPVDGFGDVFIKALSEEDAGPLRAEFRGGGDDGKFRSDLLLLSVVDEQGNRVLTESDIPALKASSVKVIDGLVDAAMIVSGFKQDPGAKN